MGITRATGVRCPWCARPVAEGADRPAVCPSCGVPLAPATLPAGHPVTFEFPGRGCDGPNDCVPRPRCWR